MHVCVRHISFLRSWQLNWATCRQWATCVTVRTFFRRKIDNLLCVYCAQWDNLSWRGNKYRYAHKFKCIYEWKLTKNQLLKCGAIWQRLSEHHYFICFLGEISNCGQSNVTCVIMCRPPKRNRILDWILLPKFIGILSWID